MRVEPIQDRSRATVQSILGAANDEFAEHGYFGAQMTQIAARAGVSPGAVYRFFPDKDALCAALANAHLDMVTARYGPIAARFASYDDIVPMMDELVRAAAEMQSAFPGYYRLTNDVSPVEKSWVGHGVRTELVGLLTELLDSNQITTIDGSPDLASVVEFMFETVRARLATMPAEPELRERLICELVLMLTLYANDRLRPAPSAG